MEAWHAINSSPASQKTVRSIKLCLGGTEDANSPDGDVFAFPRLESIWYGHASQRLRASVGLFGRRRLFLAVTKTGLRLGGIADVAVRVGPIHSVTFETVEVKTRRSQLAKKQALLIVGVR